MSAPKTPTIVNFFDKAIETYEQENNILDLVSFYEPDAADMQNGGNVVTRPVQQQRPVISGWDLSAEDNEIIEEAYFAYLGTPTGDLIKERADYMRDPKYLMDAAEISGKRQAAYLNSQVLGTAKAMGSMFYRSNATSGYDFIAEAKALMNERGLAQDSRVFILNDRDGLKFSKDLAARQTLQGRPEQVWKNGQIGQNIAGFDIYESPHCPALTGGADPATTVTGNQSFAPEPGTVVTAYPTNIVTNNDYRFANLVCAASAGYTVGDKISIANAAVTVKALNILNKNTTGQAMTFTVVAKADGTHMLVTPKPIALDDAGLTTVEAGYSNIDTQILNAATINRLNTDASKTSNLFWQKKAIEVIGGSLPEAKMKEYAGWKMMSTTMKNGLKMYMFYDGDLGTLQFRFRLFTWYGVSAAIPSAMGVAVTI